MNKSQRTILALALPVVVLVATFGLTQSYLDSNIHCITGIEEKVQPVYNRCPDRSREVFVKPFDLEYTWGIWLIAIVVMGGIEFKLLEEREKKIEREKKKQTFLEKWS